MAFSTELVRPDDLLHLRISGINLVLDPERPDDPTLVVDDKAQPAYLVVEFPPQTITERAYFEWDKVPIAAENKDAHGDPMARPDLDKAAKPAGVDHEELDFPGQPTTPSGTAAQIGHPSRLVFTVPPEATIGYSIDGLLDWSGLDLSVSPIAAIGPNPSDAERAAAPGIRPPLATETSIELPYRLVISPTAAVTWRHRTTAFTSEGRTEMWHTRLAHRDGEKVTELSRLEPASLRAIWSDDYQPDHPPLAGVPDADLGRTAMDPNDRYQLVVLTSAFHGWVADKKLDVISLLGRKRFSVTFTVPHTPEPFEAERLMLSPLGGWLTSRGHWNPPRPEPPPDRRHRVLIDEILHPLALNPGRQLAHRVVVGPSVAAAVAAATKPPDPLDLSEWVHSASLGRDHYVRIVYEGELWPFRHRAALVKVTERKFEETEGIVGAYLMQRMFIVVREPEKRFSARGNPFTKVRLTTLVTPNIAPPVALPGTNRTFWVEVVTGADPKKDRTPFGFHGVATDVLHHEVDFTVPLLFVSLSDLGTGTAMGTVANHYNDRKWTVDRSLRIPGQKVVYAEPATVGSDNTRLVTDTVNFIADSAGNSPQMLFASVKVPQVNELLGTDTSTTISFLDSYVAAGFDAATGVFARITKYVGTGATDTPALMEPVTLGAKFSADKAGGFATPDMGISSLTQRMGPLAGKVADAVTGAWDPAAFFPPKTAFLFATFDLMELLKGGTLGQSAPTMQTQRTGTDLVTRLTWEPRVKAVDLTIAAFTPNDAVNGAPLTVKGEIRKPLDPAKLPTAEFHGTLRDFEVSVLRSVFITFVEFRFDTRTGQKTDVTVKLDPTTPVRFDGDLAFVEEIRNAIPPDLFGDGPSVDITPTGVRAGFNFALPPMAVGVFALKDVSLGAALTLPFLDGKPVFDFNVSERAHPFLLTVSLFAGGGFFHLQLDTGGMKSLEVALEFGAAAAIDIGVASGEVHIMAGIYLKLERKEGKTELSAVLSGYLRMGGSLSVLGLIHVSVEFNLSFTYDSDKDKAFGRATLTVQVKVAFISKSVELTVERGFGGSGDPTFGQLVTSPSLWSEYADAFA